MKGISTMNSRRKLLSHRRAASARASDRNCRKWITQSMLSSRKLMTNATTLSDMPPSAAHICVSVFTSPIAVVVRSSTSSVAAIGNTASV